MENKISRTFRGMAIKDEALSEKAANLIRRKIIAGDLAPGEKLRENDFSEALGISRACIREAMQTLEYEGLVKKKVNRYTEVVTLTRQDMEEIYHLRAAIETCCFETAMEKGWLPLDKLEEKATLVSRQYIRSREGEDESIWIDEDFSFHEMIVAGSRNNRAIDAWMRLKNQARLVLYSASQNYGNIMHMGDHVALVKELCGQPVPAASQTLRRHIMSGLYMLESAMGDPARE